MQPWVHPRYRFMPFCADKIPFASTKCILRPPPSPLPIIYFQIYHTPIPVPGQWRKQVHPAQESPPLLPCPPPGIGRLSNISGPFGLLYAICSFPIKSTSLPVPPFSFPKDDLDISFGYGLKVLFLWEYRINKPPSYGISHHQNLHNTFYYHTLILTIFPPQTYLEEKLCP